MANINSANNYLIVLRAVKRRHFLLRDLTAESLRTGVWRDDALEIAYLQLRMMLEFIAFASLATNIELFARSHEKYATYWNADLMLKDLERINPDFYPKPMVMGPSTREGVRGVLSDADSKTYLTRREFERLWGRCGALLHAPNPFAQAIDYQSYADSVNRWHRLIVALLNHHFIRLVGDPHLYYFELGSEEEHPRYVVFDTDECRVPFSVPGQ